MRRTIYRDFWIMIEKVDNPKLTVQCFAATIGRTNGTIDPITLDDHDYSDEDAFSTAVRRINRLTSDAEELHCVCTYRNEDALANVTLFSDGTKMYWGEQSHVVIIPLIDVPYRYDASREGTKPQDPYMKVDNRDGGGPCREMIPSELEEWDEVWDNYRRTLPWG